MINLHMLFIKSFVPHISFCSGQWICRRHLLFSSDAPLIHFRLLAFGRFRTVNLETKEHTLSALLAFCSFVSTMQSCITVTSLCYHGTVVRENHFTTASIYRHTTTTIYELKLVNYGLSHMQISSIIDESRGYHTSLSTGDMHDNFSQ